MATITTPNPSDPFVLEDLTVTQRVRTWINAVTNLFIAVGSGSPEGIVAAQSDKLYRNTDTPGDLYIKTVDEIGKDATLGWERISRFAGNGDLTVIVDGAYQVLRGNKNILCSGTFDVTAIPAAEADEQEITIKSQSGTQTFVADVPVEGPITMTTGTSRTWFFADNQWFQK